MIKRYFEDIDPEYLQRLNQSYDELKPIWRYGGNRNVLLIEDLGNNNYEVTFSAIIRDNWLTRLLKRLTR